MQNLKNFSQLIHLEIPFHLHKWLGILSFCFDSDFFSCHVTNICKAFFVQIRNLKQLRGYTTIKLYLWLQNYCNSLFRSLSALGFCMLYCVQNSLARIVLELWQVLTCHSCKKDSSLVACQALLCFQYGPIGVQNPT